MLPLGSQSDPVYFRNPSHYNLGVKVITARIFQTGTDQIWQDVFAYVFQDEEGDWDGDGWRRIVYTNVEIRMPLMVTPDDIQTDVEAALDEAGIDFQTVSIDWKPFNND